VTTRASLTSVQGSMLATMFDPSNPIPFSSSRRDRNDRSFLLIIVGSLVVVAGDISIVRVRVFSSLNSFAFPGFVKTLLMGACVLCSIGHSIHVVSGGNFRSLADWGPLSYDKLAVLLNRVWVPFKILSRQFVDHLEKDVEIDVFGFVAAILLEGDVAIGRSTRFVVKSAILGHFRPILVVQLLHLRSAFPLIGEVKKGLLQTFVAGHFDGRQKKKGKRKKSKDVKKYKHYGSRLR